MIVWPKYIVSWICGLISADGCIVNYELTEKAKKKNPHRKNTIAVRLMTSVEKDWIYLVQKILSSNNIKTSIPKPYLSKEGQRYPNQRQVYVLRLRKKKGNIDQYQTLRANLEYWGITDLLVNRKYKTLCEFTEPLSDDDKALYTKPFTAKDFLEL